MPSSDIATTAAIPRKVSMTGCPLLKFRDASKRRGERALDVSGGANASATP